MVFYFPILTNLILIFPGSQEEALTTAYRLLVGMAANLTTSGNAALTFRDVQWEGVLRQPVCYLWLAMRLRGISPTNEMCRQSSCYPIALSGTSPTRSQALAYVSLHSSVHILRHMRRYIRRQFD